MCGRVTWGVQNVQAAISKVVVSLKITNFELVRECDLMQLTTLEVGFVERRVLVLGVAREEILAELWSCHDFDMFWELLKLPAMIEVIMTENEGFDILEINTSFSQNVDSIACDI